MSNSGTNWAGNHQFTAQEVIYPTSLEQVQTAVARSTQIKAVGARHSFNAIADGPATQICLAEMPQTVEIHPDGKTATVAAGMTYGQACAALHSAGYAIHNMASLPHITLGGAVATATHGSGDKNGNLATAVAGQTLICADGTRLDLARDTGDLPFAGAVVNLGALGVVTHLTLDIRPAYNVRQAVYEDLPLDTLLADLSTIVRGAYSVSLFTDWQGDTINQVWLKEVATATELPPFAADYHGARLASVARHPSGRSPADACTPQLGEIGPWHERLPHFRVGHTPSMGNELQSEYFVARTHAPQALAAVAALKTVLAPVLIISEVRTIAADDLWLSPAYGQDAVGIHFTLRNDWPAVRDVLPHIESALAPFNPRPHWGKLSTLDPAAIRTGFPRLGDFAALAAQLDPQGKFRNDYLAPLI